VENNTLATGGELMTDEQYAKEFTKPIIRIGTLSLIVAFILAFVPAITIWLVYGIIPTRGELALIFTLVLSAGIGFIIVEPISYYGVLGAAGTYMGFLAGNIMNMRVPSAIAAQGAVGVKAGTKEGEVIATIGIAGSMITNLLFVTLGALGGAVLLDALPPGVKNTFAFVPVAIFAIMFATFFIRRPDLGSTSVITALLIITVGASFIPAPIRMLLNVILIAAIAIVLYRRGNINKAEAN